MYDYEDSINILISKFPLLRPMYEENIEDYDGLPYIFYESIFVKYINEIVDLHNESKIIEVADFLEDMLKNGDVGIKNLIEVAVIESLYFERKPQITTALMNYLGSLAKSSYCNCNIGGK